jgi:hypothetical protein
MLEQDQVVKLGATRTRTFGLEIEIVLCGAIIQGAVVDRIEVHFRSSTWDIVVLDHMPDGFLPTSGITRLAQKS